jgi:SRSO17 transposase
MNVRQLAACAKRLQEFLTTMLAGVGRAERRRHGALYVQGLLLDGERKSIEPLARRVPSADAQALQQFVGQSPWAWEPVRRRLAQRMEQELRPAAAWIIDDTEFPNKVATPTECRPALGNEVSSMIQTSASLSRSTTLCAKQRWTASTTQGLWPTN